MVTAIPGLFLSMVARTALYLGAALTLSLFGFGTAAVLWGRLALSARPARLAGWLCASAMALSAEPCAQWLAGGMHG